MSRWWRAYDEAVDDPKLQTLPAATAWGWFNLMCLASANDGVLPSVAHIAFKLRVSPAKAETLVETLKAAGLIDETDAGLQPHNWAARQFKSDVSTGRVKQHRERKRTVPRNGDETFHAPFQERPQRQSTETETETEKNTPSLRSGGARASRGTRLPDGWMPDQAGTDYAIELIGSPAKAHGELEKFGDYWRAQPGQRGVKTDWPATWRNWCRRAAETRGGTGPPRRTSYGNGFDDVANELSGFHEHGNHDAEPALGFAFDDTAAAADPPA